MLPTEAAVLATMWVSGPLDWLSRTCLKSAVRHRPRVRLYTYRPGPNVPDGVEVCDAREVIPESDIFRFDGIRQPKRIGSYAPFADMFRYRMLGMGLATWFDSDVCFLRPLGDEPLLLSWEGALPATPADEKVGSAVMRIPPASPLIRDLVAITSKPYAMPPWVPQPMREATLTKLAGRPLFPGAIGYASYGPGAVTHFARQHGLIPQVGPYERFYPVDWRDVRRFGIAEPDFLSGLTNATTAIHIWNSQFSGIFARDIPKGSFADRLREESADD